MGHMYMQTPNVLDGKPPVYVKVKIEKMWVLCVVERVYYKDIAYQRMVWLDVAVVKTYKTNGHQRMLHVDIADVHASQHEKVMWYVFQQEESDTAYKKRLVQRYACHVSFNLQAYRTPDGYSWQGILAIDTPPQYGKVYQCGLLVQPARFSSVCLTPLSPCTLYVEEGGVEKVRTSIHIVMGDHGVPQVYISDSVIAVALRIGGHLYSGKIGEKRKCHVPPIRHQATAR